MSNTKIETGHNEMRQLLPWFVNGALAEREMADIQRHLDSCSECRADVAIHRAMRTAVNQDEATPIVPSESVASLLDCLAEGGSRARFWPPQMKYAAAAAVVFAALIIAFSIRSDLGVNDPNNEFTTATSAGGGSEMGYVLRVRFESGISLQDRERVIQELGGADVRRVQDSDVLEILLNLPALSLEELEGIAEEAQDRSEVQYAEFVALQLPVR